MTTLSRVSDPVAAGGPVIPYSYVKQKEARMRELNQDFGAGSRSQKQGSNCIVYCNCMKSLQCHCLGDISITTARPQISPRVPPWRYFPRGLLHEISLKISIYWFPPRSKGWDSSLTTSILHSLPRGWTCLIYVWGPLPQRGNLHMLKYIVFCGICISTRISPGVWSPPPYTVMSCFLSLFSFMCLSTSFNNRY